MRIDQKCITSLIVMLYNLPIYLTNHGEIQMTALMLNTIQSNLNCLNHFNVTFTWEFKYYEKNMKNEKQPMKTENFLYEKKGSLMISKSITKKIQKKFF